MAHAISSLPGLVTLPMVTLLTVTFPKAMLGKMFCVDVVKAAALLVAVLASPSRKVVVS